jgi:hypothetical protein
MKPMIGGRRSYHQDESQYETPSSQHHPLTPDMPPMILRCHGLTSPKRVSSMLETTKISPWTSLRRKSGGGGVPQESGMANTSSRIYHTETNKAKRQTNKVSNSTSTTPSYKDKWRQPDDSWIEQRSIRGDMWRLTLHRTLLLITVTLLSASQESFHMRAVQPRPTALRFPGRNHHAHRKNDTSTGLHHNYPVQMTCFLNSNTLGRRLLCRSKNRYPVHRPATTAPSDKSPQHRPLQSPPSNRLSGSHSALLHISRMANLSVQSFCPVLCDNGSCSSRQKTHGAGSRCAACCVVRQSTTPFSSLTWSFPSSGARQTRARRKTSPRCWITASKTTSS